MATRLWVHLDVRLNRFAQMTIPADLEGTLVSTTDTLHGAACFVGVSVTQIDAALEWQRRELANRQ